MSLTGCLQKAKGAIHPDDKAAIIARSRELRGNGTSADDAARQAVQEQIDKVRGMLPVEEKAAEVSQEAGTAAPVKAGGTIEDVGEKIGGARKDTAVSTGPNRKRATDDDRPAWARRFDISQIVTPGGQINEVRDAGRWIIRDKKSLDWTGQAKQVGRSTYATEAEAEAFVAELKTREDDAGNVAMFSIAETPPFYSALTRAAETVGMNAAPAAGWKMWLKGLPQKGDEGSASEVAAWLTAQDGKITKRALLDHLQAKAAGGLPLFSISPAASQRRNASAQFDRAKAVAKLSPEARNDPAFGPERTDLSGDVLARAALWERTQAFANGAGFPAYSIGVDDSGNLTVGQRISPAQFASLTRFADAEDVGIYVLDAGTPSAPALQQAMRDAGYKPVQGLALDAGVWRRQPATSIRLGTATHAYKPRGFSEYLFDLDAKTARPETAGYAADPNPQHQHIVRKWQEFIARGNPAFVLDAVVPPGTRADLRSAAAVARGIAGHKVIFVRQPAGRVFNGSAGTGINATYVLIDVDSNRPVMAVLGHELLHRLRATRPDLYDQLHDRIALLLRNESNYQARILKAYADAKLPALNAEKIREELIADIFGDEWSDPEFWRQLGKDQPTGLRAIVDAVAKFLDDLIAKITRLRPFGTEFYLSDLTAARAAVLEATREFSRTESDLTADAGEIKFSAADPTDTAAFKRWFGDSKVVDAQGKPLVVYHGTPAGDIDVFKVSKSGSFGGGIYTTPDAWAASIYANEPVPTGRQAAPTVYPVYVSIQNPAPVSEAVNVGNWRGEQAVRDTLMERGYDGVIDWRSGEIVAFRPEQIKSATGNRGTYDAGNPDIRFSVDHTPEQKEALARAGLGAKRSVGETIRNGFARAQQLLRDRSELASIARQATLDQFHGIDRAVKAELGGLPVDQDPYVAARLANGGTSGVMRALLLHGQAEWSLNRQHLQKVPGSKGLLEILQPLGTDLNDWFGWMVGNRAARLKTEGREHNLSDAQIKTLQGLATGKEAQFRKVASEYATFKRSVLDVAEKAGLIDADGRKVWDNSDYIPFYRQIDDKATFSPTGKKGLAGQSSGIRMLKGGESALNDPMENLLMNFSRLIDASLKNNAIRKTVAALAGTDLIQKVGYDFNGAIVPKGQVKKTLMEAGTPEAVLDVIPDEAFEGMAKMWAIQAPTDPDVVRVMVNGHPTFYKIGDPLLLKALTSFVPFDFPGLFLARGAKRILTRLVTSTPEFMLRNWIRDSMATQAIAKDGFNPAKSLQGIVKSYTESGAYEPMLFAGASFQAGNVSAADPSGTAQSMRRALRKRGLSAIGTENFLASVVDTGLRGAEHYFEIGEAIENANREAVYEATQNATGSATAAAYEAKNLMDFNLRGSSAIYQVAADVLPFFNARVQGLYRLGRSDPKRLAAVGGMILVMSILLAMANDGQDWYEELEDWDKDTYWHFKVAGKHFRLPKPFEIGAIFASLPERIGRRIKGLDTGSKTLSRAWALLRDQLAFDPVPQIVAPAYGIAINKDRFRDRKIENIGDEGKLPHARFSSSTSDTARVALGATAPMTDKIGLSPKDLEYLVNGYFGTVGMYALAVSDMVVRKVEGKPPGPALRLDDLPVLRAFYREDPARSTVFESDLYKLRDEADKIAKTIKAYQAQGEGAKALKLLAEESKKAAIRPALDTAAAKLGAMSKARDKITNDPKMTPDQKRQAIDALQTQRNALTKGVMTSEPVRAAQ